MAESEDLQSLPPWVPSGEPYRGRADERDFYVDSEDGFAMKVYIPLERSLPRPTEIRIKEGRPLGTIEERFKKPVSALAELGVQYIDVSLYDPPCISAELPLRVDTPLLKTEAIARLLLDIKFYAEKPNP